MTSQLFQTIYTYNQITYYLFCTAPSKIDAIQRFLSEHDTKPSIGPQIRQNTSIAEPAILIAEIQTRLAKKPNIVVYDHLMRSLEALKKISSANAIFPYILCITL